MGNEANDYAKKFRDLTRSVLGGSEGKEWIKMLEEVYCEGNLCGTDANATYYKIGQRDTIMQIKEQLEED